MGNLEGSSGYCTWLLTLKLLRGRFTPIWGKLKAFSSATWPWAGDGEEAVVHLL